MAREIRSFAVTVGAHTFPGAPLMASLAMPTRQVDEVEIVVPPGPNGQVGFALAIAGQQVIPYNTGQWIVATDEVIHWPLDGYPDSGAWMLLAYNEGTYDHTLQVRFLLSLVVPPPAPILQPIPPGQLSGSLVV